MDNNTQQKRMEELKSSCEKLWRRRIQPLIVAHRSKKPLQSGWLDDLMSLDQLSKTIDAHPDVNIGALLGGVSCQLFDIDIDEPSAIPIFHRLMSPTSLVFGRKSKPGSHLLYRMWETDPCGSVEYHHPITGKMIAEGRGNLKMTVFPPSIHPSGERIEYEPGFDGEPSEIAYETVCRESGSASSAFLLLEQWVEGSRHNKTVAFAGFCAINNIAEHTCEAIIEAVVEAAGDEEPEDRLAAIRSSYQRHRGGQAISGINSLIDLIGAPTANKMSEWLGVKQKKRPKSKIEDVTANQQIASTDLDFARDFKVFLNGDMIFCDVNDSFYERRFGVYSSISKSRAQLPVHKFLDQRLKNASSCEVDSKSVRRMQSSERMNAILRVAQPLINVNKEKFDQNPKLVGCLNGVLNIENGILIDADDFITRRLGVSFDQEADCCSFKSFLESSMAGDAELISFLQRVFGYILSGLTSEQCMFIFVGEGSNGKSTLQNVIYKVMGEYASAASMQTLVKDKFGSMKTDDIAALEGCRYVFAQEAESNQALAEAKIKRMTGGDPISVRALFKSAYTTQPVFKLCLFTNRIPKIDATDNAIWRRLNIIPFSVTIQPDQRIRGLDSILANEGSGILNWMVKGFQEFTRMGGLCPPQKIVDLKASCRTSNDTVEQFTDICCDTSEQGASTSVKLLYDTYVVWCANSGIDPLVTSEFGKSLQRLGFNVKRKKAGNHRLGIKLTLSLED